MAFLKRKSDVECKHVATEEDGTTVHVCTVDEGKVFEVRTTKDGTRTINPKYYAPTPDDYKKVYKALAEEKRLPTGTQV